MENCILGIPPAHTQAVADSTSTTFKPEILICNAWGGYMPVADRALACAYFERPEIKRLMPLVQRDDLDRPDGSGVSHALHYCQSSFCPFDVFYDMASFSKLWQSNTAYEAGMRGVMHASSSLVSSLVDAIRIQICRLSTRDRSVDRSYDG